MEYEKELKILDDLKNEIYSEKSKRKRLLLINDYFNLIAYLEKARIISHEDYISEKENIYDLYCNKVEKAKIKFRNSFIKNFNTIKDVTNNLMEIYNENPLVISKFQYFNSIDIKNGLEIIYDFFGELGNDFYKILNEIFDNDRITYITGLDFEGTTYNVGKKYGQYIILRKPKDGFDYENISCIAHEIGHCYEIKQTNSNKLSFPLHLLTEVVSLFVQKLFDQYNIKNNLYKNEALNCQMVWQITLYKKTLVNDFTNKYLLNNIIARLDYNDFSFELDNINNPFINEKNEDAIEEFSPSLNNYSYVLCDHIANYFVKIYKENEKEALKLLKHFIAIYYDKSLSKMINEYGNNFDETKRLIKEVSNYQRGVNNG